MPINHRRPFRHPAPRTAALLAAAALAIAGLPAIAGSQASVAATPPYLDQALPFSVRAADLVSRMTMEEKLLQFKASLAQSRTPSIARLGVKPYNFWNEALHGVARNGLATEFPTGLGIASTWNRDIVRQMADAIADEARDKYNDVCLTDTSVTAGCTGLTYWSPTINLARDPRWGRAEESYGEDSFLSGELAGQFTLGLQGGQSSFPDSVGDGAQGAYLKAVATPKHYLANDSEVNRHNGTSNLTDRSLHEYYTAAFGKAAGTQYGAKSLMSSYNAVNINPDYTSLHGKPAIDPVPDAGTPAPANKYTLETLMRRMYGFDGFVTSDCTAIEDTYEEYPAGHSWTPAELGRQATPPEGAAYSVKAGTDLDCVGRGYTSNLPAAQSEGLITEQDYDIALTRAFTVRMQLGEFDDLADVPWSNAAYTSAASSPFAVASPEHLAISHAMSLEAPVLLKNDGVLPFTDKSGTTIVLGQYSTLPIHGDYSPAATTETTSIGEALTDLIADAGAGGAVDVRDDAINGAFGSKPTVGELSFSDAAGATTGSVPITAYTNAIGWTVRLPYGSGGSRPTFSPDVTLEPGQFTIPVTVPAGATQVTLDLTGTELMPNAPSLGPTPDCQTGPCPTIGTFQVTTAVSGASHLETIHHQITMQSGSNFQDSYQPITFPLTDLALNPGATDQITFAFSASAGGATGGPGVALTECAAADCSAPGDSTSDEAQIKNATNVVVYLGSRESDSSEEYDRTSIEFARYQSELATKVAAWNPDTVVWIQTAGQMDISEFADDAAAIVWSTYNGQFQGMAAAETLFNETVDVDGNPGTEPVQANPSGKLTFTYYSDVDTQLTATTDYALTTADGAICGRTYWYYQTGPGCAPPDYPFGHGLSYSTFAYTNLALSTATISPNDSVDVSVTITNTGTVPGRETAQLYVSSPGADGIDRPLRQLKGFAKTGLLAPGVSETLTIPLDGADMWFWDEAGQRRVYDTGTWRIDVGTSSDSSSALRTTLNVTGTRQGGVDVVAAIPDGVQLNLKTPTNAIHANLSATRHDQSFYDLGAPGVKVTYSSSDPHVATVDRDGTVLPVGQGAVLITATVNADGETGSTTFPVTVRDGRPSAGGATGFTSLVAFADTTVELASVANAGIHLTAGVVPAGDAQYTYRIAPMDLNEAGATITPEGAFTASTTGRVRVTVTAAVDTGGETDTLISRSAIVHVVPNGTLPKPPPTTRPPTTQPPASEPPTTTLPTTGPGDVAAPVAKAGLVAASPATARVGVTQTAILSGWEPAGALPAYQWAVGGRIVSTAPTYRPTGADAGKTLTLAASIAVGSTIATTTITVGKIAKGTIKAGKASIKGTAKVGKTLKATTSRWPAGVKFTYRWYAGGKAIKGATKPVFTVKSAQVGKKINVKIAAKRTGYTTTSKTSTPTKKVSAR
ncbi:MAG: glycoside hydrolase family 3 C-terminal domain-containing protein [Bifidobacteriaceae bacterium]|nr:glycoside hydrolase family 3 C-terminal domain-containing protein [Bifidobacteriaceae bacterium]